MNAPLHAVDSFFALQQFRVQLTLKQVETLAHTRPARPRKNPRRFTGGYSRQIDAGNYGRPSGPRATCA